MQNYTGNMFASIKNGQLSRRNFVSVPYTKFCEQIVRILWDEGFILSYTKSNKKLTIFLKYLNEKPVINFISYVSKPSRRFFFSAKQIWKLNSNQHFIIFSTNKGLKTIIDCKKLKLGGEPLILIA